MAVIVHSDLGAQENKVCHRSHFSPFHLAMKRWGQTPRSQFFKCWVLSQLFHSCLSPLSRGSFSFSSVSAITVVSTALSGCWYFFQKSWIQLVIHPAWHFPWCTLHISYITRVTTYSLEDSFPNLEPVCCPMSNSCYGEEPIDLSNDRRKFTAVEKREESSF